MPRIYFWLQQATVPLWRRHDAGGPVTFENRGRSHFKGGFAGWNRGTKLEGGFLPHPPECATWAIPL